MPTRRNRALQPTRSRPPTAALGMEDEHVPLHAHVAYFWETDQEFAAAIGFLEAGLRGTDHCVIFGHEDANQSVCRILRNRGFDIAALQAQRRLTVLGGSASGDMILHAIATTFEQAIAGGAPLIRLLGNIGWGKQHWPDQEALLAFEAKVTAASTQFPCVVVCMYDVPALSGLIVHHGGFETHPFIVRGHSVRQNPYYVPTDLFLARLEAVAVEIAGRQRAEVALQKSEERFRTLFESAPIGISINDTAGRFIQVNQAFQEMLGHTEDAFRAMSFRDITVDADLAESTRVFAELAAGKRREFQLEKRYQGKNGSIVWANTRCSAVRDVAGNFLYTFAMVEDITERKRAEQALREALAEVEHLKNRLQAENVYLQEEIKTAYDFEEIVGQSAPLRQVLHNVEQVARTDATVLIHGETGTGKELLARAIHHLSQRKDRPLVKVNCGAIPTGLVESELFGHEKGAFTGAVQRRIGRFELAHGGSIFLDEVSELPLETQIKLLRVLQDGEFERVGSSMAMQVDVRVIAATNRALKEAVQTGGFRADLFYRLNVFPLEVPPLRERQADIPLLVHFFLDKFAKKFGKQIQGISNETMERLMHYAWPGNVREVQNVIERALVLAQGPMVRIDAALLGREADVPAPGFHTLEDVERAHILRALEETAWVIHGQNGAAAILGMNPSTLRSRMGKLGIKKPPRPGGRSAL